MVIAVGDRRAHTVLHVIAGCVKMLCHIDIEQFVDKEKIILVLETKQKRVVKVVKPSVSGMDTQCQQKFANTV